MFKVIVERPRCVNSNTYKGDGRPFRNREDGPLMLGMKKGYSDRKWLNENLAPLKRFLEKQVNRPWDKVYGEIRAAIDARSTVKQHILQHLDNFVAIQTRWEAVGKGGRVMVWESSWSGRYVALEESRMALFVHPLTGILLRNRRYISWDARRKKKRVDMETEKEIVRRKISDRVQLLCIDDVWYEVTLDVLPCARVVINEVNGVMTKKLVRDERWDVVRKIWVAMEAKQHIAEPGSSQDRYGCATLYAAAKRQLSSKEIQAHRLTVSPQKQKARKGLLLLRRYIRI